MSDPKRIICTIGKDGKVMIEADGYAGEGCVEATAPFEEVLGTQESQVHKNYAQDRLVERENNGE